MILHGDCRDVLRTLDAHSIQCCVTSPPYWGLRDYIEIAERRLAQRTLWMEATG